MEYYIHDMEASPIYKKASDIVLKTHSKIYSRVLKRISGQSSFKYR